ncbi:flagellar hook protein FlgE [Acetobacter sp.]|jgi:flagellar hook protein FlgE|uniref:flagellar hook protein FlgE n=1 Tax=Acetobacter sp. TaxID=440 RepID=UPI0025C3E048|nr:flagellar hook-basal body complex protein [Acetobacter sp.]MCH4089928.1 flagellar hook-basal body complex protein [Acetobacter sp.]MCI1298624.1 flagellar hook-basal body complex protein [Acetobacter sp.]MCI1315189.1 flagellar hook-basal body complex protein [Acetobacter sp.]
MSIFNSLTTAVAGINAQSTAFTNLSNNIANSQTVGYKASDTSFQDTVSNNLASYAQGQAVSDGVTAYTTSQTQKQGTISASTNTLALAISGNGFFDVSQPSGQATAGKETFSDQQYFTRNGNFYQDKNGYLFNTSGYYLNGYMVDPKTGTLNNTLTQIQISDVAFRPTETTTLTMSGGVDTGKTYSQTVYDSTSQSHTLSTTWTQTTTSSDNTGGSTYTVAIANGDSTDSTLSVGSDTSTYTVDFDSSGNIKDVKDSSGNLVGTGYSGSSATLPITLTYSNGAASQTVDLDLGTVGSSAGTTTAAANSTTPTLTSDSVTSGTYQGISMESDGSIMATFSNGDTQLVGKVALASFVNPNGLMAVDGQAYQATSASGSATIGTVGSNGTGILKTSSTESSTTDLTSDLSSLIVTQEAYTANTKIVTTADTLLQATIAMIR